MTPDPATGQRPTGNGQRPTDWLNVVRRARLGRTVKAVALGLATHADFYTGEDIHPGIARLSVEMELTYNIVQEAIVTLCQVGLLEKTRRQVPAIGRAAEYRLIFQPDAYARVTVLTPTEFDNAAEAIREANHRIYKPQGEARRQP